MSDGISIPYRIWSPEGKVRAVVVASPGLDEAACELSKLGRFLAAKGCIVYSCDLRGQPSSLHDTCRTADNESVDYDELPR
jgi:alpha-beta hydrolase superfamily lysophospholipase